jgi:hypothetical protein
MNNREKHFTAENAENAEERTMSHNRDLPSLSRFFSALTAFSAVSVFLFRQGAAWQ